MQLLLRLRGATLALRSPLSPRLGTLLAMALALGVPGAARAAIQMTGPATLTLPRTGSSATLALTRITNTGTTNTSSLRLELWLFSGAAPANAGDFAAGTRVISKSIPNLLPAQFIDPVNETATASPTPAGVWTPVIAVSELVSGVFTPQAWIALAPQPLSFPVPPPSTFLLTTNVAPALAGTLSRVPDLPEYQPGDVVTITATPNAGQVLQSWTGCSQTTATTCTVTMTTDVSVTANFLPAASSVTLTVNATPGNGGGFVQTPDLYAHPVNAAVSVTAIPAPGFAFQGWSGCNTVNGTLCNVTMDANRAVTATFVAQGGQALPLFALLGSRPGPTQSNLVRIDRATGAVTPFPQWTTLGNARLVDAAFAADGSLVAIADGDPRLFRIDRTTFQITMLALFSAVPTAIDVDASGRIGALLPAQLVRFDPATGVVTPVATGPLLAPAQPADPIDFAAGDDGTAWVLRWDTPTTGQIVRVDAATGAQTVRATSASLSQTVGPVLGADGLLYAWSRLQSPGVRRIDPGTGVVSSSAFPGDPNPAIETLAVGLDGAFLGVPQGSSPPLQRIDVDGGARLPLATLAGIQGAGLRLVGEVPPSAALLSVANRRIQVSAVAGSQGAKPLFDVRNAGLSPLDFTAQVLPGAPWLAPTPAAATLPAGAGQSLATNVDARTLVAGARYPGRVRITHVGSPGAPIDVAVELAVTAPTPVDAGALTTSLAAPQVAGTTITLTASATGGTGAYEYKFWSSPDGGRSWTLLREWDAAPSFNWKPLAGSAQQIVAFWVRRAGATADAAEDYTLLSYPVTAAPAVVATGLSADKPAPQNAGTTIQLTATATGGPGGHQFKFWMTPDGGRTWQMLRDWGTGSLTWVPITGTLATQVAVWVRPLGSTVDAASDYRILPYGINPAPPIGLNAIQASLVPPSNAGTPVTLTAAAAGGTGAYEYKWWGSPDGGVTWTVLRDWGSGSFDWTPFTGASWLVGAWVRTLGSTADTAEAASTLGYAVNAPPTLSVTGLAADQAAPKTVGTLLTLTATTNGGLGPVQYKFWVSPNGGATWSVIRDWATSNTTPWIPTVAGANTQIAVWARNAGATADALQASLVVPYAVAAATAITVSDIATVGPNPVQAGNGVGLTAVASGGVAPLQFKFWASLDGGTTWTVVRDWGSDTATWTPLAAGPNALIAVWARSATSTADAAEAFRTEPYPVSAPNALAVQSITPSLPAPQLPGTTITLQAASNGGIAPVQYKWWTSPDGGTTWTVLRDWGSDTVTWTPTSASARWTIAAWARSQGVTADAPQAYLVLPYAVRPFAERAYLDVDGDGTSDLVGWDPATSPSVVVSRVQGGAIASSAVVASLDASWEFVPAGDANGDGKADLVWHQKPTGAVYLWFMNGAAIGGSLRLPDAPAGATLLDAGDFDGDGDPDLLWWNANSGAVVAWLLQGATKQEGVLGNAPGAQPPAGCVGDFDDDGKDDVLWADGGAGVPVLGLLDGLTVRSQTSLPVPPAGHEISGLCPDLTGDRKADVLWGASAGGSGIAWVMDGAQVIGQAAIPYGGAGREAAPLGDYDGDGGSDLLWVTPAGGLGFLFLDGTNVVGSSTLVP